MGDVEGVTDWDFVSLSRCNNAIVTIIATTITPTMSTHFLREFCRAAFFRFDFVLRFLSDDFAMTDLHANQIAREYLKNGSKKITKGFDYTQCSHFTQSGPKLFACNARLFVNALLVQHRLSIPDYKRSVNHNALDRSRIDPKSKMPTEVLSRHWRGRCVLQHSEIGG